MPTKPPPFDLKQSYAAEERLSELRTALEDARPGEGSREARKRLHVESGHGVWLADDETPLGCSGPLEFRSIADPVDRRIIRALTDPAARKALLTALDEYERN